MSGKIKRALVGLAAAATMTGATALSLPATASAASANAPAPPVITTTVDGNTVDFEMADPNSGFRHLATTCTPALIDVAKAIPLLPDLAAGTIPPLDEIDPAMFAWGPVLLATNAGNRNFSRVIPDVPNGIYLAVGVCINPAALDEPAIDFTPVFVGSPINVGSSALGLGSGVLATPGGVGAILDLLGVDTGSLGSAGSTGSAGSISDSLAQGIGSTSHLGSTGSAFGSTDTATGSAIQF